MTIFAKITLALALVHCLEIHSQSITLDWIYQYPYENNGTVVGGAPDETGQYYVLANYLDTICFSTQAVLCKVSMSGNHVWAREFVEDSLCEDEAFSQVLKSGSDLIMAGSNLQGWLVKIDSGGSILWAVDSGMTFGSMSLSANSRITVSSPPMTTLYNYDTSGAFFWTQALPIQFSPIAHSVLSSGNGWTYVYCNIQDTGAGETQGVGLFALDANGNVVLDSIINHKNSTDPDLCVDISENESNEVFMLARDLTNSGIFINKYDPVLQSIVFTGYLPLVGCTPQSMQVDTLNHFVYADAKCSNGFRIVKYNYQLIPLDTIIMDTCLITSEAFGISPSGFVFVAYRPFGQNKILYLNAYDPSGNCIANFSYLDTTAVLSPKWIQFDTLGNIYLVGNAQYGPNNSGLVMRFNSTVGIPYTEFIQSVSIFPNPTSGNVTVATSSNIGENIVVIRSISGQVVSTTKFSGASVIIDSGHWNSGIYLVEVTDESGQRYTNKLIVTH